MDNSTCIAVFSAIVSVIAMLVTLWQTIITKKTYNIEKKRRQEEQPNFKVNSLNSKAIVKLDEKVSLKYYIVISNLSNRDMTIKSIKLRIIGEENMVVLEPNNMEGFIYIGENIQCNKSIHNWVEFELTKSLYYDLKILKFIIEIEDVYGNKQDETIIYMNEEVYENVES